MTTRRAQEGEHMTGRWQTTFDRDRGSWVSRLVQRGEVLAIVEEIGVLQHAWSLADGRASGVKESAYAAQRAVRKALREANK